MRQMKVCANLFSLILAVLPTLCQGAVLRDNAALVEALRQPGPSADTFDIVATVTYVSTNNFNANANIAATDDVGSALFRREDQSLVPRLPGRGSRARFRGGIASDPYGRRFALLTDCDVLAHGMAPPPVDLSYAEIMDSRNDYRLCRFSGKLLDAACQMTSLCWIMLTIGDRENHVFATVPSFSPDELSRLEAQVGRTVTVTGICVPYDHSPRRQVGRFFKIASPSDIRFENTVSSDDGHLPTVDDLSVTRPADLAKLGRHRARGYVVAAWSDDRALVRTARGDFVGLRLAPNQTLPRYGTAIDAIGLPETDLFKIDLVRAVWRELPAPPLDAEPPRRLAMSDLLVTVSGGRRRLYCSDYLGQPVLLSGTVRSRPNDGSVRLYVECGSYLVTVDATKTPHAFDGVDVGCTIDVAGTCVLDVDSPSARATIPRLNGFMLVVRTPADVTVVSRPSWWTPGRLMALIGILLAALLAITLWNTALRRLAERRGKALADETLARATADLKVYERTRLAVELHDTLAQNLTGVSMEIDAAKRFASDDLRQMERHLDVASRSLKSCRDDLRNCLWDLRHETLENADMAEAIRQTLAPHVEGVALAVRFSVPRERISDNTAHAILRIVRELSVNAVRHGRATEIRIAGSIEGDKLLFSVRDNGCGFDPERCPGLEQGHYGLQGIRERIDAFEGDIEIRSHPGDGTKVTIALNIPSGN